MSQAPRVSTAETAPNDSQVIPIDMPDPMPEVTTQQVQHTQDEDEQEIDVVGVDEVETNNTETIANVADTRSKEIPHPS